MEKKLTRIPSEAVLGGVAAGMADYFNIDKTIVRLIWAVALLLPVPPTFGWTAVIYIILWAALPEGAPSLPGSTGTDPSNPQPPYANPHSQESSIFPKSTDPDRAVKIMGVLLLGIGAFMLLDELPMWYRVREYIWPVALIGLGAFLLLRQRDKEQANGSSMPPPNSGPTPPTEPFPPVEPDPVPYRPFGSTNDPAIDPDAPADPDGETNPDSDPPQVK